MPFDAHKNLASSTVATAPAPPGTGSTLVVAAGHGTRFPVAPFDATVWPSAAAPTLANAEIVRVTSVATDTLQIVRAQGGTTARAIGVGDLIAASITAKTITDVETEFAAYARLNAANTFTNFQTISQGNPSLIWNDTAPPVNSRVFSWQSTNQQMLLRALDDGLALQTDPLTVTRPGDLKVWRDLYEKQRTTPMGHWSTTPYTAAHYSATAPMAWTVAAGGVTTNRYALSGKTLDWTVAVSGTTSGTAASSVMITLPNGLTTAVTSTSIGYGLPDGATWQPIQITTDGNPRVSILRLDYGNFAIGTIYIKFSITIEVL